MNLKYFLIASALFSGSVHAAINSGSSQTVINCMTTPAQVEQHYKFTLTDKYFPNAAGINIRVAMYSGATSTTLSIYYDTDRSYKVSGDGSIIKLAGVNAVTMDNDEDPHICVSNEDLNVISSPADFLTFPVRELQPEPQVVSHRDVNFAKMKQLATDDYSDAILKILEPAGVMLIHSNKLILRSISPTFDAFFEPNGFAERSRRSHAVDGKPAYEIKDFSLDVVNDAIELAISPHNLLAKHGGDQEWMLQRLQFASLYNIDAAVEEIMMIIEKNINYDMASEVLAFAFVYNTCSDKRESIRRMLDYVVANKVKVSQQSMTILYNSILHFFVDTPPSAPEGHPLSTGACVPADKRKSLLLAFAKKALTSTNALQTWIIAKRASDETLLKSATQFIKVYRAFLDGKLTCQLMALMTEDEAAAFLESFDIGTQCFRE